ncbi:MAG: phenylacetaldoxime dehydratase family protein [Acidimicrobiaceae bacterium]|nr:phenylacetaldoxime dehydratase family protein [Acidimicrobiaceae bacterium]
MAANRPEGHTPSAPAWCVVDFPELTAYSMIFSKGPGNADTLAELQAALTGGDEAPDHVERARVVNFSDEGDDAEEAQGDIESVFMAYWVDPAVYERWRDGCEVLERSGVYCETAIIPAERWETIAGTKRPLPGVRNLTSVDLTELHDYWGAARDRMAASADDPFEAAAGAPLPANLCLICSGQKWDECLDDEREMYFTNIEPKLRAGIEFLAANRDSGCISSRFLREQTIDGEDVESTSFVGWFDDLASLEAWSKSHSTHLAIFHSFLSTVHLLGRPPKLRLWHEVSVLPEGGVELVRSELSPLADLLT